MNFDPVTLMPNCNLKNKLLDTESIYYSFSHIIYKQRAIAYGGVLGVTCLNSTGSKRKFMTSAMVIDDNGVFFKESSKTQGASKLTIPNIFHHVKD